MPKLCVFAGTTEGREIAEFLAEQSADVTVCVATEYGETLLPQGEGLHISARPLPREEMAELFRRERFDLVIDATHPYAKRITESIAATCAGTDTEYLRLLRPDTAAPENAVFVEDAAGAAEYLDRVDGNILLTTGSRELHAFACLRPRAADGGFAPRLPRGGPAAGAHSRDAGAVFQGTQRRHAPEHRRGVSRNEGLRQRRRI